MRKKILFLSPWYPNRFDPMPGLFVKRHAELLTTEYTISVLSVFPVVDLDKTYEINCTLENDIFTVRVYYKKIETSLFGVASILKISRYFKAHYLGFKEIIKSIGLPDWVHVNILTRVGLVALFLKYRYGVPFVITEHWSRYLPERGDYKGFFRKIATKWVVSKSEAISTVSQKLKDAMINCGIHHSRFYLINNAVDINFFRAREGANLKTSKMFAHISCFDDTAKNVTGIIHSVYALSKQRSDFVCLMVGEGSDLAKAERLADDLGINGTCMKFTGLLEGEKLVDIYNQSDFTILFSNYENMPVVIPESFACGKPVVATKVGGIPEFINNKTGLLVSPGDEIEFTESLSYMLDHFNEFDPLFIRNFAQERFSSEAIKMQINALYGNLRIY